MKFTFTVAVIICCSTLSIAQSNYGTYSYDSVKEALPRYSLALRLLNNYEFVCNDSLQNLFLTYQRGLIIYERTYDNIEEGKRIMELFEKLKNAKASFQKNVAIVTERVEEIGWDEFNNYLSEFRSQNSIDLIVGDTIVLYCDGCKDYSRDLHEYICSQELRLELVN